MTGSTGPGEGRADAAERARDEAWAALEKIASGTWNHGVPASESKSAIRYARAVLAARDVASKKAPDGPRDLEGE